MFFLALSHREYVFIEKNNFSIKKKIGKFILLTQFIGISKLTILFTIFKIVREITIILLEFR